MKQAIDILHDHVEATCGLFMDSLRGWEQLSKMLESLVDSQVKKGMTREQALMSPLIHGVDHPTPENVRHVSTLGARLDACAPDGFNVRALSSLGVVSIFAHWEDKTRGEIAKALGIELHAVRSPCFPTSAICGIAFYMRVAGWIPPSPSKSYSGSRKAM
ncbi:hypothetical protein AB8E26_18140 [Stenotrophomonas rhizophila]|uniref:hypothetical protein n=1 Tax=Stenotrophomonas rhizophila TaxID=216778 RepID=UPI003513E063